MDVQVVGSVYGAALYVTHYICKDESQALKQAVSQSPTGCNSETAT